MLFEFSDDVLGQIRDAQSSRSYLHLPKAVGKGLEAFHPSRLLNALFRHLNPQRVMQLAKRGEPIAAQNFVSEGFVDGALLQRHLNDGAALLLIGLQEWVEGLATPVKELANALQLDVSVNAYVGGPQSRGFLEHVDHHDVVVVQIEGEKEWTLWEPTLGEPLELPRHQQGQPKEFLSSIRLGRGDLLFVPRGIWHVARGLEGSGTAHLSFGLQPLTALHWLSAMRTQLIDELIWRRDIPAETSEREVWLKDLQRSILKEFTLERLEQYLMHRAERFKK